jgi:sugar lactone lactonase YvrE
VAAARPAAADLAGPAGAARPRWDTRVLALVPKPGLPALAYVHPNRRIYAGTYDNPAGDTVPSRVFEHSRRGALLRSWTVRGQNLSGPHGVQVATSDAAGRLVLLDKSPARVLVLDRRTGRQRTYATFPDLPVCPPLPLGATGGPCSPALRDQPPMPDYAAWGPDGALYATDYQQAVIWRVPPRGGTPQVWLADRRLDGDAFGTAGIALAADRRTLLVTQASSAGLAGGNPATGKLYAVAIAPDGRPGAILTLWESHPADAPDGFAIARSGRVYVALVGAAAQIAVIGPDGREEERFPQVPGAGDNGSAVPFDSPSSAMFLGSRLIVANQGYVSGNAAHQAILDVETGERGLRPLIPRKAGPRPAKQRRSKRGTRR